MQAQEDKSILEQCDRARRWTREEAEEMLKRQEESGLSITAFARQEGVRAHRIWRWKRYFVERGLSAKSTRGSRRTQGSQRAKRVSCERIQSVRFIPAILRGEESLKRAAIILRLGHESVIEIADPACVPTSWVSELVRALGEQER
jgi:transposase-like protein